MNETLEQEIATLEQLLEEKKATREQEEAEPVQEIQEKEIIRDIIGDQIQQSQAAADDQAVIPPEPQADPAEDIDLLAQQVKGLVTITFGNNLKHGISEAVKTKNAAIIDAYHDALVDELYDQLVARKKVDQPK